MDNKDTKKGFTLIILMFFVIVFVILSFFIIPKIKLRINKAKDSRAVAVIEKLKKNVGLNLTLEEGQLSKSVHYLIKDEKETSKIFEIIAYGDGGDEHSKPGEAGNNLLILVGKSSLKLKDSSLILDSIYRGKKLKENSNVIKIRISNNRKNIEIVDSGLNSLGKSWSEY